jgi:glucose-1-phosphate thymidylyltransferase
MRAQDDGAALTAEQAAAAETGVKALVPIGRPFLDHVLSELADAGFDRACLVIGPEHDAVRAHYDALDLTRITVDYAVQAEPRGTADAVLAAADWVGGDRFSVINSDNLYPAATSRRLRAVAGAGLVAYDAEALTAGIDPDRVRGFAIVEVADGRLVRLVEKPDAATLAAAGPHVRVSMNHWLFTPAILDAARDVPLSSRGEYELPAAVALSMSRGEVYEVVPASAMVLDLSRREDVARVTVALADHEVIL